MPELFVYGTLRQPNGGRSEDTVNYIHIADGVSGMRLGKIHNADLFDCGPYPALASGDGVVCGEVLTVTDDALAIADEIESHPEWYERRKASIALDGGSTVEAWVYWAPDSLLSQPELRRIESGDWFDRIPFTR